MPLQPTYPGVYIEEMPSSVRTIVGVPTSITAFMGRALKGPVNEPVTIFNYGDFEREFGGLDRDYPLGYAVKQFYENGGGRAVIVRLFKKGVVSDGFSRATVGALKFRASTQGAWGNDMRISIKKFDKVKWPDSRPFGLDPDKVFNINITKTVNNKEIILETIDNVSLLDEARQIHRLLEDESKYIKLELDDEDNPNFPADINEVENEPFKNGYESTRLSVKEDFIGKKDEKTGLYAFEKTDLFNILCIPPDKIYDELPNNTYSEALTYCKERRAILLVDPPESWKTMKDAEDGFSGLGLNVADAINAAIYFPRIRAPDPCRNGQLNTFPPCGAIAGVINRTDNSRGVWKAPAGIDASLNGVLKLSVNLTDEDNGTLNPIGINCLRTFPLAGHVIWGARTLRGADQLADQYKYLPVRRTALFIEESLFRGTKWVVFEPNDEPLWSQIRLNIGAFMQSLFRQGAFQGGTPKEAYFVKCDKSTTTQDDINKGIVNILVGFAPIKPAEFVMIKISQIAKVPT